MAALFYGGGLILEADMKYAKKHGTKPEFDVVDVFSALFAIMFGAM